MSPLIPLPSSAVSSTSSSSHSFINEKGAGTSSSAAASSPSGDTSHSSKTIFTPGATSTNGMVMAVASPSSAETTVDVAAPASQSGEVQSTPASNSSLGNSSQSSSTSVSVSSSEGSSASSSVNTSTNLSTNTLTDAAPVSNSVIGKRVQGDAANNRLRGSRHNDQMWGRGGDDKVWGGHGDDLLSGSGGADTLVGGFGTDTMTGGGGQDCFVLDGQLGDFPPPDIIADFRTGQGDVLKLSGRLSFDDLSLQAFDSDNNGKVDATIIQTKSDNTVLAIVSGAVNAAGKTTLTQADFV